MRPFAFLLILALSAGCLRAQSPTVLQLDDRHTVLLLDSLQASEAVVQDTVDHFFDRIGRVDMEIQLHRDLSGLELEESLELYRAFLAQDVRSFSEKEAKLAASTMQQAFALCNALNPEIFPDRIRLIKTAGKYYGPGVYYTREDYIVIPEDALAADGQESLLTVMLHEIFHVFSRYRPEMRRELYALIGFEPLEGLQLPKSVQERLLLNPDGIDLAWGMRIADGAGESRLIVPVITSWTLDYEEGREAFFDYLRFQLFPAEVGEDGRWQLISNDEGASMLGDAAMINYFRQSGGNTQYLIHPDEILADNFVYVLYSHQMPEYAQQFQEAGRALIQTMTKALEK